MTSKRSDLSRLNIVPGARIAVIVWQGDRPVREPVTTEPIAYTPRHIATAIRNARDAGHNEYSFWVKGPAGWELWTVDDGAELARKL